MGLSLRAVLLEWVAILVAVLSYCANFLDLGTTRPLAGNEAEVFQFLDWVLVGSLQRFGEFPLWNPFLQSGIPFVADPFSHLFNPLATLPVLLLGVMDGFKVGLFLSFLAAALGMWWLAVVLGLNWSSRLWVALMYAFTGQAAAKFLQGHYDFVLGFPWIPWALASLLAAVRLRHRSPIPLAALSLALLFFSGNGYYAFYMLMAVAIFVPVAVLDVRSTRPFLSFRQDKAKVLALVGLLALGLVAVQLLPALEFWPRISKATNLQLTDSQTLLQALADFVSRDPWRSDALRPWLQPEEYYAYTGIWPFLALAGLPLAFRRKEKSSLLYFYLLLLLALVWIDVKDMPWRDLYSGTPWLSQFRYPTRILILGACALIALAGMSLDSLCRTLQDGARVAREQPGRGVYAVASRLAWVLLVGLMVWSVADVYGTNRQYGRTRDSNGAPYQIMNWLRGFDSSEYFVWTPGDWHGAVASNLLRYNDAFYGFGDIRELRGAVNRRTVRARPNYRVLGNDQTVQDRDALLVRRFETHAVYRLPHSLPFAFSVRNETLMDPSEGRELQSEEVSVLAPLATSLNRVEISAQGEPDSTLVVLTNMYPGWQVSVDGLPQSLKSVSGYLATDLQPGAHRYVFSFSSTPFTVGLIVTVLSAVASLCLLLIDLRFLYPGAVRQEDRFHLPRLDRIRLLKLGRPYGVLPRGWARLLADSRASGWALFSAALLVCAVTRLWALEQFPIYFFTDEAAGPLWAEQLLSRGLRDSHGALLPVYFEQAAQRWMPLLSVYLHLLPVDLFGKSIIGARATSALVSLLGTAAVAIVLRSVFHVRFWWAGVLLMAITPAWFLHSRTAFETVVMVSFYACFLLFYLLYRTRSPLYLFPALLLGAASFYSYSNGQAIVATLAILLLLSDIGYHLHHWRTVLLGLLLGLLLVLPLLTFRLTQPDAMQEHLRVLGSYWFQAIPVHEKVLRFVQTYLYGLSPQYWFFPNGNDLGRHLMKGYGHIRVEVLPLVVLGIGLCLRHLRSSPHRAILFAAMSVPVGAALVEVGITRVLAFVVPAGILAGLGLNQLLVHLPRRMIHYSAAATFAVLSCTSLWMLREAVFEGPLWFRNYGLYGMQYGAGELFGQTVPEYLKRDPNVRLMVSPSWANGTDNLLRFFLSPEQQHRVQLLNVDFYMAARRDLDPNTVLVMTPEEYDRANGSPKFKSVEIDRILPYPDGTPGFYFARLGYAEDVEAIVASEREMRRQLVEAQVVIDGQAVQVRHSRLDMGELRNMFDGDRFTLARGMEANPFVLEMVFPEPRGIESLAADFGSMDLTLTARLYSDGVEESIEYSETYRGLPPDPHVVMTFDGAPGAISRLRLEIKNLQVGDIANIHVRELALR